MMGKIVCRHDAPAVGQLSLSTEALSSGVYMVQVRTSLGTSMRKLQILK